MKVTKNYKSSNKLIISNINGNVIELVFPSKAIELPYSFIRVSALASALLAMREASVGSAIDFLTQTLD